MGGAAGGLRDNTLWRVGGCEGEEISLGTILKKENVNTSIVAKMPFLSFLAINYNIPVIAEVQEWFESCIIRSYANPMAELQIMVSDDAEFKNQILLLLNDMGIDVDDYRFDEKEKQLYLKRRIKDTEYELPFDHESDGTKKLIAALQEGRLVIIDELDAKLHPKLLRYVISMFKNQKINRHGAQLLFTSHDMATMKNTVFRRDEIWFAALNENHSSEIYSLYEIRREDNENKLADPQTTLMILCNPPNPTGNIWTREELGRIGRLCAEHRVRVISDEIHCDLTEPGCDYVPFASVSTECALNSVTCIAPTKTFNLAGLQTAVMVVPDAGLRYKMERALNMDEVAEPGAFAIDAAFTRGDCWLDCSGVAGDATEFCRYLRSEAGLYLSAGIAYGGNGGRFLRMNIACPRSRVEDGLLRLKRGLKAYEAYAAQSC